MLLPTNTEYLTLRAVNHRGQERIDEFYCDVYRDLGDLLNESRQWILDMREDGYSVSLIDIAFKSPRCIEESWS